MCLLSKCVVVTFSSPLHPGSADFPFWVYLILNLMTLCCKLMCSKSCCNLSSPCCYIKKHFRYITVDISTFVSLETAFSTAFINKLATAEDRRFSFAIPFLCLQ